MAWSPITVDLSTLAQLGRSLRFTECSGSDGAFAVAAAQTGMAMAARSGNASVLYSSEKLYRSNGALLGADWETLPGDRETVPSDIVLSSVPYRTSERNDEILSAAWYAGQTRAGVLVLHAPIALWNDPAGRQLVQLVRDSLQRKTHCTYRVLYLTVDDLTCGGVVDSGPQLFVVFSQFPVFVDAPRPSWLPTAGDAIGDLTDLPLVPGRQPLHAAPTWWSAPLRDADHTVDGHVLVIPGLFGTDGLVADVAHFSRPVPSFAVTGGLLIHPMAERSLTYREEARLCGFPDAWNTAAAAAPGAVSTASDLTVTTARWVLAQVLRSFRGGSVGSDGSRLEAEGPWTYAKFMVESPWREQAIRQWGEGWSGGR